MILSPKTHTSCRAGASPQLELFLSPEQLLELLETIEAKRGSGRIEIETKRCTGAIWFRRGALIDVEVGTARGPAALCALLETGEFRCRLAYGEADREATLAGTVRQIWHSACNHELSQSQPFPLISAVRGPPRLAPRAAAPRTVTLSGPPVRIPPLPMLTVTSTEPASNVQVQAIEARPMSPPSTESSTRAPLAQEQSCVAGPHLASCVSQPEVAPEPAPRTGSRNEGPLLFFGRYEVVCPIGVGGMSTVYLCRLRGEAGFHRLFAVKALRPDLSRDPVHARLFLQESRVAAGIHHPNVVSILDAGVCDGQPYVVMDYVEGSSLSGLLDRNRLRRSPRLLVPIILDALHGLHAAHESTAEDGTPLELVHCDVSPQNLLVGSDGIGRINDFGVARARGLRQNTPRGKAAFLSPEQLLGENVDRRSDIFSIGTVMWCALTGEHLFKGASLEATVTNVIRRKIEPPSQIGLKPPACLDRLVLKALERDPDHRFHSAAEMLDALREIALTSDLLGAASEIGAWVERSMGPDLERRRRKVWEGAHRTRAGSPACARAAPEQRTPSESGTVSRSGPLPQFGPSASSSTLALAQPRHRSRRLLFGVLIISLITLGISLLFSSAISRLLSRSHGALDGVGEPAIKER